MLSDGGAYRRLWFVRPSMREDRSYLLGASPLRSTTGSFLLACALWPGLIALSGLVFGAVGVLCASILVAFPAYQMLRPLGFALGFALNRQQAFNAAQREVQSGALLPDWVVRDAAFTTVLAVDEVDRRMYVNGAHYALDDIATIEARFAPEPLLQLTLHDGPVALVKTGTSQAAHTAYTRLLSLLDIPEAA